MNTSIVSWTFVHALLILIGTALSISFEAIFILIWIVSLSIALLIVANHHAWSSLYPAGGLANHVTFTRFIVLILSVSIHPLLHPFVFTGLVIVVMIADGIDGYLARRLKQNSEFGAVFDMEVDAFLALSLSFLIWQKHPDAFWVLVAGSLRYLFVILYHLLGWHKRKRPEMPEAKLIAVLFFISLLVPQVLDWRIAFWCTVAGCVLVTVSFVREFFLINHGE
jgi:phosphatidylglycerophosphate synthase